MGDIYIYIFDVNTLLSLKKEIIFYHFNYTPNYTLNHKLFECMFCTLNYDLCYTLLSDIKFVVNLDGKV